MRGSPTPPDLVFEMIREKTSVHIRWMIRRDVSEVLQIELGCSNHPWKEEDLLTLLRQRNCIGMVAEYRDKVVGFMVYELHPHYIDITRMCVSPTYMNTYVGSQMIQKLKGKLSSHRRTALHVTVRETDLKVQQFLRSHKFVARQVIRNHFEDTNEDGYFMIYEDF